MHKINQVAIVGGTHGNEFTGAYLVKKFEQSPDLVGRPSFTTHTLFANPKAFAVGRRYTEEDLNRCFLQKDLDNPHLSSYEALRAKTLSQILGPKGNSQMDFLLDLHSTTANMHLTIILVNDHPLNLRMAAYLSELNPEVRVFSWTRPNEENSFLHSLCDMGFTIEVGPVAQAVLHADLFQQTEALIHTILDVLEALNQGNNPLTANTLTLYQYRETIDYPKDQQGEIQGMIHPRLQNQDYTPLHPGDPLFLTLEGETIPYSGNSTVWPIFINEAAYYEKGIAMCLTEKKEISLEKL
jgi:aspartoacylase